MISDVMTRKVRLEKTVVQKGRRERKRLGTVVLVYQVYGVHANRTYRALIYVPANVISFLHRRQI